MKAKLENHRVEEEWRIRMNDILKACKIPTSHIYGLAVAEDEEYEDEINHEKDYSVLVIKIIRESKTDKQKKKKR